MNKLCFCSSFIYLTNCILAYAYDYNVYALIFFCLFVTSTLFHSNNTNYIAYILDKISIFMVVCYGGYVLYSEYNEELMIKNYMIMLTFLLTIYLYYYGWMYGKYCYDQDEDVANKYHSLMHVISSIGHLLIIHNTGPD